MYFAIFNREFSESFSDSQYENVGFAIQNQFAFAMQKVRGIIKSMNYCCVWEVDWLIFYVQVSDLTRKSVVKFYLSALWRTIVLTLYKIAVKMNV